MLLNNVKILHIEPTDACNAACPQCAREFDVTFDKLNLHHLSLSTIKEKFTDDFIKSLDKMFMCGVYGDPAAGKHTLEIFRYFRKVNPSIVLGMNSNGGIKSVNWWKELAGILNQPKDYVVFSIDGLNDTNKIYRRNTSWVKIIQNAQAFINAGGNAHWDMLVFEHNEHQVDECERLAKQLGFKIFRCKVSRRHNVVPVNFLTPPKNWKSPAITFGKIECQALKEKSVYIDAQGKLYPCCWLGHTTYTIEYFTDIVGSWSTPTPNNICHSTCATVENKNNYTSQWHKEVIFNV